MAVIVRMQNYLWSLIDDKQDLHQWGIILGCFLFAVLIRKVTRKIFDNSESKFEDFVKSAFSGYKEFSFTPLIAGVLLWIFHSARFNFGVPCSYIHSAALLITAYSLYRLASIFSKDRVMPKMVGGILLIYSILYIFQWIEPLKQVLTSIRIPLGEIQIDIWKVLTALISLFILLWLVSIFNKLIDASVDKNRSIPASIRVLIGKTARLLLYVSAFLISLKIAGVNLAALAFFSGALGLGLGFGLQKVISNLVSGVIILLDKSIKPGDVIEINGTYGWINTLRTRYVSVLTRDRKEILIPNEDFVTNNLVNWSFSDTNVRIKADVGIAYGSDLEKALECCEIAAKKVERVLQYPAPSCLLLGFGDSSIDLQIRFWINDASGGVANVRSEVLIEVWRSFKENGISIPFPQREVLIKHESPHLDTE